MRLCSFLCALDFLEHDKDAQAADLGVILVDFVTPNLIYAYTTAPRAAPLHQTLASP